MKKQILTLTRKSDLISVETECPQCGDRYVYGVPKVSIPCKNCNITYTTNFSQDLYTKVARRIETLLAFNDEVTIKVEDIFYKDITAIKHNYDLMKCWDIEGLNEVDDYKKVCSDCGICKSCRTCCDCGATVVGGKCKKCGSTKLKQTRFKKYKENEKSGAKECPQCGSENVRFTVWRNKTSCHVCSSTKSSKKIPIKFYELTISRKKVYRL
jgi:uncharacterized protein (DUF983 family)